MHCLNHQSRVPFRLVSDTQMPTRRGRTPRAAERSLCPRVPIATAPRVTLGRTGHCPKRPCSLGRKTCRCGCDSTSAPGEIFDELLAGGRIVSRLGGRTDTGAAVVAPNASRTSRRDPPLVVADSCEQVAATNGLVYRIPTVTGEATDGVVTAAGSASVPGSDRNAVQTMPPSMLRTARRGPAPRRTPPAHPAACAHRG